jgi:hypothetical protein
MNATQEQATRNALADTFAERQRQHEKWGVQRHDWPVWITVLTEEVGELSQQILAFRARWFEYHDLLDPDLVDQHDYNAEMGEIRARMRAEAVQVAAVAIALIEHIDDPRGDLCDPT